MNELEISRRAVAESVALESRVLTRRNVLRFAMTLSIGGPLLALAGGCGSANHTVPVQGTGLIGGGAGPVPTGPTRTAGHVILPPGSPLQLRNLTLVSGFATAALSGDGTFTLNQLSGDPAFLTLTDARNQPLLLGFSASDATAGVGEVSPMQTAVALVFYALGGFTLPADSQLRVRTLLAQDSKVQALGLQAAKTLAANPLAIAQSDSALFGAVITLRDAILGGTGKAAVFNRHPSRQTIVPTLINVNPAAEVNGFFAAPNADGLGLTIMNSRRRNAFLYIYATAYTDQNGIRHTSPDHKVVNGNLFWATSGVAGVVGSLIDVVTGTVAYAPVTGGPYSLDLFPADAVQTEYRIDFVGNGNGNDPQNIDGDNPNYGGDAVKISFITFIKDLLLPAIATIAGFQSSLKLDIRAGEGAAGTELLKAFDDLAAIFSGVVDSTVAISQSNAQNLLVSVLKAIANNGTLRQQFIGWLVTNSFRFGFAAGLTGVVSGVLASALNAIVIIVDKLLGAGDLGAVIADWGRSDSFTRFDAKVIAPKVKLNPATASLKNGDSITLTAVAVAASGVTNITYHWTILSGTGTIKNTINGLTGTSIDTSAPTIQYLSDSNAKNGDQETIQVQAFVGGINDPKRLSIGTAMATITIEALVPAGLNFDNYTAADYRAAGLQFFYAFTTGIVVESNVFALDQTSGSYLVRDHNRSTAYQSLYTGYTIKVSDILAATSTPDKTPPAQASAFIPYTITEPIAGMAYDGRTALFFRRGSNVYFIVNQREYPFVLDPRQPPVSDAAGTIAYFKQLPVPPNVTVTYKSG